MSVPFGSPRVLVAVGLVLAACGDRNGGDDAGAPPAAAATAPTFVGAAACAGCHPAEAQRWRGSQHALAMQEASPANVLGDFDAAELSHFGRVTRFERRGDDFVVVTDGPDGQPVELEVAYTFGVYPLQQYLVRQPGGRLQALPMAWDSRPAASGGQRWFHLYPDDPLPPSDPLYWARPQQNWNHMCSECHSTQVRKEYREDGDRYETSWEELDVACEACHGPGSRHVDWARAGAPASTGPELAVDLSGAPGEWAFAPDAPIAARAEPGSHVEVELCARCHSRRGRLSEDYVYGRPLLDTHRPALLEAGLYYPDGQIQDEVYVYGSFLQSAMYRAGVSCSDCHDPHSLAVRNGVAGVCAQCHRPEAFATPAHHHHQQGSAGASCVACHMPSRVYMQVDPRRDHGFRIPRPDLSEKLGVPNACEACHAERGARWAAESVAGWRGGAPPRAHFAQAIDAGRRHLPGATRLLARLADDRRQAGIVRATGLELLGEQPLPPPEATLETAAGSEEGLLRLAVPRAAQGLAPEQRARLVAPLLGDDLLAVRVEAARSLADVPAAAWPPGERARQAHALAEYRETLRVNADRPEAQVALGLLHLRQGELAEAERAYLRALEIEPATAAASVNLADLYRMQDRDADAERTLREALKRTPDDADLEHALGLTLVRRGRRAEALAALGRAAELAPERSRHAYVYAIALAGEGQRGRALAVLERTLQRHPGDPDVLLALATLSRDAGDLAAARRWARQLVQSWPEDAQARALLASLGPATPPR